jgi:branched-chain amino acid transport system substrate-binding protein
LAPIFLAATSIAAGCGSSTHKAGTSSGQNTGATVSGGKTYTLGVIADLTGPASSDGQTLALGIKAGIGVAATEGYHFKYVVADTGSSPTGALSAAQLLVNKDHAFAVVLSSGLAFSAAPWLNAHGIPVVGADLDSTEWTTDANMFSIFPMNDPSVVTTNTGDLFKSLGATVIGSLGYSISPASAEAAKSAAASSQHAGLKVGYLNASVPFGSTNVGPYVLGMKDAGVDGYIGSILPNTNFAIVQQARIEGMNLKVVLLADGYGGDLPLGGKESQSIAQGLYFTFVYQPVELQTAATIQFQDALRRYAAVSSEPTLSEYIGYLAIDGLVTGLKTAGSNPTQQTLIKAMSTITNYQAAGLLGGHGINWVPGQRLSNPEVCFWTTQYLRTTFHPVKGASPICGTAIPGQKVSG